MKGVAHNLEAVAGFHPVDLWRHFAQIAAIPRPSGKEDQVLDYVMEQARNRQCEIKRDSVGNLLVVKPGTDRSLVPLAFQGHVDMVCEKNAGNNHRFDRDPIIFRTRLNQPGWLFADGTTLGADNGIGIATMLALMDRPEAHQRDFEFLFTVDEETGLTGAQGLAAGWMRGKTLLNLDTEEEGSLYVGCSGGMDLDARWTLSRVKKPSEQGTLVLLEVKCLRGGHSGIDIDKQRANALKVLTHTVQRLMSAFDEKLMVICLQGGQARNAIPREALALLWLDIPETDEASKALFMSRVEDLQALWRGIYQEADRQLCLWVRFGSQASLKEHLGPYAPKADWDPIAPRELARWLQGARALPSQAYRFQLDIPGLVRTSGNWGVLESDETSLLIRTKLRGSYDPELQLLKDEMLAIVALTGGQPRLGGSYCGWQPDLKSPLLAKAQAVHERVFGEKAQVKAIHAGLECGLIGSKYPGMQMISFGPHIQNAHSPDEAVEVESVARFWKYVVALVEDLDRDLT